MQKGENIIFGGGKGEIRFLDHLMKTGERVPLLQKEEDQRKNWL
jgi:hypothetical protein